MDFPQFPNIHRLIPQILDLIPKHTIEHDYHQIEDPDKWEIYVKYRKIVSQFLVDQRHRGLMIYDPLHNLNSRLLHLDYLSDKHFVGQEDYVSLAKYLLNFLSEGLW